jgi:hypothetical protein
MSTSPLNYSIFPSYKQILQINLITNKPYCGTNQSASTFRQYGGQYSYFQICYKYFRHMLMRYKCYIIHRTSLNKNFLDILQFRPTKRIGIEIFFIAKYNFSSMLSTPYTVHVSSRIFYVFLYDKTWIICKVSVLDVSNVYIMYM